MTNLNLDPVVGEEVGVLGQIGLFKITHVDRPDVSIAPPNLHNAAAGALGLGIVDLEKVDSGSVLQWVPWAMLEFDETRPIRRCLDWLHREHILQFPEGISSFDVRNSERYDGEPQFIVRFQADSDLEPTEEKMEEWRDFSSKVREELLSRLPIDRWVRVTVRQSEESLHATC